MSHDMENKRYVVFDFDGTIYLQGAFISQLNYISTCILRFLFEQGYTIAIITGRYCSQKSFIFDLLLSNGIRISPSNFYCRTRDEPEVDWKKEVIEEFLEKIFSENAVIFEYHEDNAQVLDFVSRLDKNICLYIYTNGLPAILRKTSRCVSEKMIESCVKEKYGI